MSRPTYASSAGDRASMMPEVLIIEMDPFGPTLNLPKNRAKWATSMVARTTPPNDPSGLSYRREAVMIHCPPDLL